MKLVIKQNVTLDGVIEAVDDWFTPAKGDADMSDVQAQLREMMSREEGLLLGRVTFEQFRGYWPQQTDDRTGITRHLNRIQKHVASRSLGDPGWENTTVLREPLVDAVRALKDRQGGELGVTGSISVCHELIRAGLVDEYNLFVYPLTLGKGRRLFVEGNDRNNLSLVNAKPFRSGIVLLTYRRP